VVFGSWDGMVYCLNGQGERQWQFKTAAAVASSPAIDREGVVYVGSHDGNLYALGADGTQRWAFRCGGPIVSSPALGRDGAVHFTSVDGWLYALEPGGAVRWKLHTGGVTEASPAVGPEGTVYVGVNNHTWAVSKEGQKLWARLDDENIEASPVLFSDGGICVISRRGMVRLFNRYHEESWQTRSEHYLPGHAFATPGVGPQGTIYASGLWTKMVAIDHLSPLERAGWPKFRGDAQNRGNAAFLRVPN